MELLPIIDNLENALNNLSENSSKEDKEGIELTLKSFESTLDKFGMVPIYPDNEEFNPNGAIKNIAGVFNKNKNVLGMMPHPERMIDKYLSGEDGSIFFENLFKINN